MFYLSFLIFFFFFFTSLHGIAVCILTALFWFSRTEKGGQGSADVFLKVLETLNSHQPSQV